MLNCLTGLLPRSLVAPSKEGPADIYYIHGIHCQYTCAPSVCSLCVLTLCASVYLCVSLCAHSVCLRGSVCASVCLCVLQALCASGFFYSAADVYQLVGPNFTLFSSLALLCPLLFFMPSCLPSPPTCPAPCPVPCPASVALPSYLPSCLSCSCRSL